MSLAYKQLLPRRGTARGAMYCNRARLCVCLSVCSLISKTTRPKFAKFSHYVDSCDSVFLWRSCDTLCVRPVLWMTSSFHTMGRMALRKHGLRSRCKVGNVRPSVWFVSTLISSEPSDLSSPVFECVRVVTVARPWG